MHNKGCLHQRVVVTECWEVARIKIERNCWSLKGGKAGGVVHHINSRISLVENMVKKNHIRFPIAVLLTTLICSHITTTKIYFSFCDCKFKSLGACDIPLEKYF